MKILVTGAKGFVGKNLCLELKNIRDGKARCYGDLSIEEVFEYDIDSTPEELDAYCKNADFVFKRTVPNSPFPRKIEIYVERNTNHNSIRWRDSPLSTR